MAEQRKKVADIKRRAEAEAFEAFGCLDDADALARQVFHGTGVGVAEYRAWVDEMACAMRKSETIRRAFSAEQRERFTKELDQ